MNFKTILITFGVLVALITLLNNELSEDPFGLVLSKTTISPIRKMMNTKEDMIPKSERLPEFVPNVEVASLGCGHWIPQEAPEETTQVILNCSIKQKKL